MRTAIIALFISFAVTAVAEQTVVLRESFDAPDALNKWQDSAGNLVAGKQGPALLVEQQDATKSVTRRLAIPADKLAGQLVTLRATVKAEGVSKPPQSWNGVKVMLVLEEGKGRDYPQLDLPAGAYDWRTVRRTFRVPQGVTGATLTLGLEQVSGKVWFDDVEVLAGRPVRPGARQKEKFVGHDLPRLRGVMHGPRFRAEDTRVLGREWNANQVRWQLNWVPMKQAEEWAKDLDAFDKWLDGALEECDKAMDACEKHGLLVLLDLHTPPGGRREGGKCRLFDDKRHQDKFIEVWEKLARRYKGRDNIYCYDLLNEVVEGPVAPGLMNWRELATAAAKAIRKIDPGKPVMIQPGPWGACDGFDGLEPLDLDRVIYSFHMYQPHKFTHQSIHGNPGGIAYPGQVGGAHWDKARLRESMLPAIEFQREYNVQIYVGEFSAIRWAPDGSAHRYLRDCIDLFEELGWDWSYHAYREWDGWSVEHGPDQNNRTPTSEPTARKKLLLDWFAKNQKPK